MKNLSIFIALIIVASIGAFVYWNFVKEETSTPIENEVDFIKTGNAVKDNPGFKPGVWYLVYEEPGAPGKNIELVFDVESPTADLNQGDRIKIEAFLNDGKAVVRKIEKVGAPAEDLLTIKLYYYNPESDKDPSGNIQCSRAGLQAVERKIPKTMTPIQDTIRLLLRGEISDEEQANGTTSEYPLPGVKLVGADLKNGSLTLTFEDPQNKTGGGSCRVGILWFQIEATAKQFPEVKQVQFLPEELFQP